MIGTVIGVIPGLGATASIALLLPLTYGLPTEAAIMMLAGVYYGSIYGGTITSVLLQLPGEAASAVTTIDGYPMAQQGRAGPALGIAAIASFIGGTVSVFGLVLLAPLLASFALQFGPPEYAALTLLGVLLATSLGTKSVTKSIITASFGLFLATIGQDPVLGTSRLTFGSTNLLDGVGFIAIAMGLFGIGEILYNLDREGGASLVTSRISHILPTREDFALSKGPIFRGAILGFIIGIMPGGGGVVSSLASYAY